MRCWREHVAAVAADGTLLKWAPSLVEIGNMAALMAPNHASPMAGAVAKMTCGAIMGSGKIANRLGSPQGDPMKLELTAIFQQVPEGYIGFVEELPGANTQGPWKKSGPTFVRRCRVIEVGSSPPIYPMLRPAH